METTKATRCSLPEGADIVFLAFTKTHPSDVADFFTSSPVKVHGSGFLVAFPGCAKVSVLFVLA